MPDTSHLAGDPQRLLRCLDMIFLLMEHPYPRKALAARYGVSERQITYDIHLMRRAGVRITNQRGQGYRTMVQRPLWIQEVPAWLRPATDRPNTE